MTTAQVTYRKGGWRQPPETVFYLSTPFTLEKLQLFAAQLIKQYLPHLPEVGKVVENIAGDSKFETPKFLEIDSSEGSFALLSRFVEMTRETISFEVASAGEHIKSFQEALDSEEVKQVSAGMTWYQARGLAVFGTRSPKINELWNLEADASDLKLRILGPYDLNPDQLPLEAKWSSFLQNLIESSLEISLLQEFKNAAQKV